MIRSRVHTKCPHHHDRNPPASPKMPIPSQYGQLGDGGAVKACDWCNPGACLALTGPEAYQTPREHLRHWGRMYPSYFGYLGYLRYLHVDGGTLPSRETKEGPKRKKQEKKKREKKKSRGRPCTTLTPCHCPSGNQKPSPLSHGLSSASPLLSLI